MVESKSRTNGINETSMMIRLNPNTLYNEEDLAKLFDKDCKETIQRAVKEGELPHLVRIRGKNYTSGQYILNHINEKLDEKNKKIKQIKDKERN